MRLVFDQEVLDDLQGIFAWIAKDLGAATNLINRIFDRVERLTIPELTRMGRIGRDPGTHELIEEPYIIVYEVRERQGQVRVISVVHAAVKQGREPGHLTWCAIPMFEGDSERFLAVATQTAPKEALRQCSYPIERG